MAASAATTGIDLYWLPLGAGGHSVRLNGRIFEAVAVLLDGRERCDLYHSALQVYVPEARFVIEQRRCGDRTRSTASSPKGGRRSSVRSPPALPVRNTTLA
jgi:hypothetical protein